MARRLKQLIPSSLRDHLRPLWYRGLRWPMPVWRLRGKGTFKLLGREYQFVDVAKFPHDWWAWQARDGTYEQEVLETPGGAIRDGDTVFDIGVYIGVYSVFAADRVGSTGRVVAFEPDPECQLIAYRNLCLNGLQDRVRLVAAAVGSGRDTMVLDGNHFGHSTSRSGIGSFEVQTVGIDDWCEQHAIWPDVIKMDIEGGEALALGDAAVKAFTRARTVVIEVHEDELVSQGQTSKQVTDWVRDQGKTVVWLESRWTGNFNIAAHSDTSDG